MSARQWPDAAGVPPMIDLAPAVHLAMNRRFYEAILLAYQQGLADHGFQLLPRDCASALPVSLPLQVKLAVGDMVLAARWRHVSPMRSEELIASDLLRDLPDGDGVSWVDGLTEALAGLGFLIGAVSPEPQPAAGL